MRIIYWIRRDLRLSDNPALNWAAENAHELYPVYIHAPDEEAPWEPGSASCWWLHHSLQELQKSLASKGQKLIIRQGASQSTLDKLIHEIDAQAVIWNRLYEPALLKRDREIKASLRQRGLTARSFNAHLLLEPWQLATGNGEPYKVFTPYWKKARTLQTDCSISPCPELPKQNCSVASENLDALALRPKHAWADKLKQHWQPGEAAAHTTLDTFIDQALAAYSRGRDLPAEAGTSRLSPYLHFGEISPRQIVAALGEPNDAMQAYIRELYWREFSHHLLFHFPHTSDKPFKDKFLGLKWRSGAACGQDLTRWQRGETGIELVDAGMRELWETGWMHNRVRMVVASLLTKNLGIHWLEGARWFWDTLVDADLANNSMGWQWVAGCGADAAPYFRIFNPTTQAEKFDTAGFYRKQWLGDATISPIVDLKSSRAQALERYAEIK